MLVHGIVDGWYQVRFTQQLQLFVQLFKIIKTRPNVKRTSECLPWYVPDRTLLVQIVPSTSIQMLKAWLKSPSTLLSYMDVWHWSKIAMLSYSTKGSGFWESVDKVVWRRWRTRLRLRTVQTLELMGIAIWRLVPATAALKAPGSKVAGQANLYLPGIGQVTLDTRWQNVLVALRRRSCLARLNKPVNDLSRGCNADDVQINLDYSGTSSRINKNDWKAQDDLEPFLIKSEFLNYNSFYGILGIC